MFQRIPQSVWFGSLCCAIVLGIMSGIAYPQNTLEIAIPLEFGWLFLPALLFHYGFADLTTHVPVWLVVLTIFYYPFAALVMAACVVWTVRRTAKKLDALLVAGLMACSSTLVCMLVALVAPSLNSNGTIYVVEPAGLVLLNLLFSAILGWGVGCLILILWRGMEFAATSAGFRRKA